MNSWSWIVLQYYYTQINLYDVFRGGGNTDPSPDLQIKYDVNYKRVFLFNAYRSFKIGRVFLEWMGYFISCNITNLEILIDVKTRYLSHMVNQVSWGVQVWDPEGTGKSEIIERPRISKDSGLVSSFITELSSFRGFCSRRSSVSFFFPSYVFSVTTTIPPTHFTCPNVSPEFVYLIVPIRPTLCSFKIWVHWLT